MHEMKVTTQMKWARERSKCISKFPKAGFCNHFNRTNFQQSNESNVNECPAKSFWKRAGQRKTWSRKYFAWRIKEEREEMKEMERESVELSWRQFYFIHWCPTIPRLPSKCFFCTCTIDSVASKAIFTSAVVGAIRVIAQSVLVTCCRVSLTLINICNHQK